MALPAASSDRFRPASPRGAGPQAPSSPNYRWCFSTVGMDLPMAFQRGMLCAMIRAMRCAQTGQPGPEAAPQPPSSRHCSTSGLGRRDMTCQIDTNHRARRFCCGFCWPAAAPHCWPLRHDKKAEADGTPSDVAASGQTAGLQAAAAQGRAGAAPLAAQAGVAGGRNAAYVDPVVSAQPHQASGSIRNCQRLPIQPRQHPRPLPRISRHRCSRG